MNRASLDRGFGRCVVLRKHSATLKKYPNRTQDRITLPAGALQPGSVRKGKYSVLDRDGIVAAGEILSQGGWPTAVLVYLIVWVWEGCAGWESWEWAVPRKQGLAVWATACPLAPSQCQIVPAMRLSSRLPCPPYPQASAWCTSRCPPTHVTP